MLGCQINKQHAKWVSTIQHNEPHNKLKPKSKETKHSKSAWSKSNKIETTLKKFNSNKI